MEILTFFLILFIIIIIIFLFFYLLFNKPNKSNLKNSNQKSNLYLNNINTSLSSYELNGNEEELLNSIEGYENELLIANNLQQGTYENQFEEIDFSKIPPPNMDIGFNPIPHDRSEIKIPYADINVNCL